MPSSRTPVAVLGLSHVDYSLAVLWLNWAVSLAVRSGGDVSQHHLVIFANKRIGEAKHRALLEIANKEPRFFKCTIAMPPDEHEVGYPGSATHLFIRALEHCEREFPGRHVLWIETDAIPTRPSWFEEIAAEHASHHLPFTGVYVDSIGPHMAGCGIYPPDWRRKAPLLEKAIAAPSNTGMWRPGTGQAWDTFVGSDIAPKMFRSKTIQQIWRPGMFNEKNLNRIKPETCLFHQCKNGSLIACLSRKLAPGDADRPPNGKPYYCVLTSRPIMSVLDGTVKFIPCARGPGGAVFGVYAPSTLAEECLLDAVDGTQGITKIDENEYNNFLRQRRTFA